MSVLSDITDFIFVDDEPTASNIIFIPGGSWPEPSEKAAELWRKQYAPIILPSGKYSIKRGFFPGSQTKKELYFGDFETEWEFMKFVLMKLGVSESAILKEDQASAGGTKDNAFFSRKVTDSLGLQIKKGIICCKPFHARRALMTYQWAYPEAEILVCPVNLEEETDKTNWFKNEHGKTIVMGELERCGKYFTQAIEIFSRIK